MKNHRERCSDCHKRPACKRLWRSVPDPRGPEMGGWMYETKDVCTKCFKNYTADYLSGFE